MPKKAMREEPPRKVKPSTIKRIKSHLEKIEEYTADFEINQNPIDLHRLADVVNSLCYEGIRALESMEIDHEAHVNKVLEKYQAVLKKNPDDAVSLNNVGMFLSSRADYEEARPYITRALEIEPNDYTIHMNLYILDVMQPIQRDNKCPSREVCHKLPDVERGEYTIESYFDPHGL